MPSKSRYIFVGPDCVMAKEKRKKRGLLEKMSVAPFPQLENYIKLFKGKPCKTKISHANSLKANHNKNDPKLATGKQCGQPCQTLQMQLLILILSHA